ENCRRTIDRFLRGKQGCHHRLFQTKFLTRIINHDPEVSEEVIANNAIQLCPDGLTENREEIGDDDDKVIDARLANPERLETAGGNVDLRATSSERAHGRTLEIQLLCHLGSDGRG